MLDYFSMEKLKWPFTWEKRCPLLLDRVLYVPEHYDRHEEWERVPFDHPEYFGNRNEIFIEYCAGNGAWIVEMALKHPELNWIGVDYEFERVKKIWARMKRFKVANLIVVSGEALTFTRHYLPSECVQGVYVNFPDPWPKPKHAKNRLFQPAFIEEMGRVVKKGGKGIFVTDDLVYQEQISFEMQQASFWKPTFKEPFFVTEWPGYGTSYFDALWRKKGKTIHYFQFEKSK